MESKKRYTITSALPYTNGRLHIGHLAGAYIPADIYARFKRITDNEIYAMKKVKLGNLSRKEKENALNEIRILASVNHKNVIAYKEAFFDQTE